MHRRLSLNPFPDTEIFLLPSLFTWTLVVELLLHVKIGSSVYFQKFSFN